MDVPAKADLQGTKASRCQAIHAQCHFTTVDSDDEGKSISRLTSGQKIIAPPTRGQWTIMNRKEDGTPQIFVRTAVLLCVRLDKLNSVILDVHNKFPSVRRHIWYISHMYIYTCVITHGGM